MNHSMRFVLGLTVLVISGLSSSVGAHELSGLGRVVTGLSEPGSLLLWGSALAGLSTVTRRRKA